MYLHSLNSSKILMGIAMLILNVGSKYVQLEFSKTQESALKSALTREILIFVIIFTATHDIIISILMTAAFVILANHLFNDQSKFCIIPQKYWAMYDAADTNKDGTVSPEEEAAAIKVLEKAKMQKEGSMQKNGSMQKDDSIQKNDSIQRKRNDEAKGNLLNVNPHESIEKIPDIHDIFPKKEIFGQTDPFSQNLY